MPLYDLLKQTRQLVKSMCYSYINIIAILKPGLWIRLCLVWIESFIKLKICFITEGWGRIEESHSLGKEAALYWYGTDINVTLSHRNHLFLLKSSTKIKVTLDNFK